MTTLAGYQDLRTHLIFRDHAGDTDVDIEDMRSELLEQIRTRERYGLVTDTNDQSANATAPQYQQDLASHHGLPMGFTCDPQWAAGDQPYYERFYVNDGPRRPGEDTKTYKARVRRACEYMGIEHRVMPRLDNNDPRWKDDRMKIAQAKRDFNLENQRLATAHHNRLNDAAPLTYDAHYKALWDAEKQARQARNKLRRDVAVAAARGDLLQHTGQRLPTPPPPDDSGDELWDWGDNGPKLAPPPRSRALRNSTGVNVGSRGPRGPYNTKSKTKIKDRQDAPPGDDGNDGNDGSTRRARARKTCSPCYLAHTSCSLDATGIPCDRCRKKKTPQLCVQRVSLNYNRLPSRLFTSTAQTASPGDVDTASTQDDSTPGPRSRQSRMKLKAGSSQRLANRPLGSPGRARSRSPTRSYPEEQRRLQRSIRRADGVVTCSNCQDNNRICQSDGGPCVQCVIHRTMSSCDAVGDHGQLYEANDDTVMFDLEPTELIEHPPAPQAGDESNPLASILEYLNSSNPEVPDEGVAAATGGVHPFQSVPPRSAEYPNPVYDEAPLSSQYPDAGTQRLLDHQWGTPADPAGEMASHSQNWLGSDITSFNDDTFPFDDQGRELDRPGGYLVPGGRVKISPQRGFGQISPEGYFHDEFGRELDLDGVLVPGGRVASVQTLRPQDFGNTDRLNVNPITGEFEENPYWDPRTDEHWDPNAAQAGRYGLDASGDSTMNMGSSPMVDPNIDPNLGFNLDPNIDPNIDPNLDPNLPTDPRSFGLDPAMQPNLNFQPSAEDLIQVEARKLNSDLRQPIVGDYACDEIVDYWNQLAAEPDWCVKRPTKACDHFQHQDGHTCVACHAYQNDFLGATQQATIDNTKRWLCRPCTDERLAQHGAHGAGAGAARVPSHAFRFGMCICTLQMRKAWLCHQHRQEVIARVAARTLENGERAIRESAGAPLLCPTCGVRPQDPSQQSWGCMSCYDVVLRAPA